MSDIANLSNLAAMEPLDWDGYKDSQEATPPPPKGRYTFRAAADIPLNTTQKGALSAQIDPTVVGPSHEGAVLKFARVNGTTFKRGSATVSFLGDYLRACRSPLRPTTPDEWIAAVQATAGAVFEAEGDWEAYDSATSWRLKGMENFPDDGKGGKSPWVKVPVAEGEEARTIRANFKITRFIAAT